MNNLFRLTKIELLKFLSSFNTKGKKVSRTPIFYVLLAILGFSFLGSLGYSFLFVFPFTSEGLDSTPAVAIFAGVASLLTFMTTMSQARGIYIGEDYDLLTTLPIKKSHIVGSKIISLYAIELIFSIVIMIPHGIVQIILAHNVSLLLISILLAFTLPIVPIAIAIIASLLVTLATARFKAANFIFVILYALVIIGISGMGMIIGNMKGDQAANGFASAGNALKWINPTYFFIELSFGGNYVFLLIYLAITVAAIIFSVLFIALFFDKLHEIVSSVRMKKEYVRKDLKNKSEGKVLLGLEFKRLVNSKLYFTNTIIGSIMAIMGSVVYIVSMYQPLSGAEGDAAFWLKLLLIPILLPVMMFIFGIGTPTGASINIEGKNFWIIKSLPINYRKYLRAKLIFAWIMTIPASLIVSTVATILFHESVVEIIFLYVIPIIYLFVSSLVGMIIALSHPKLKWNSESEAVKNSATTVISMLINVGIAFALAIPLIILVIIFPEHKIIAYGVTTLLLLIALTICYINLRKNFQRKIEEIENF